MVHQPTILSEAQIQTFIRDGAVHLPNAIDADFAERCAMEMLGYMGIDEHDPSTWAARLAKPGNRGDATAENPERRYSYETYSARLWGAMCDLMGGAERIIPDKTFRSNGVYNLASPTVLASADPASHWHAPLPAEGRGGWHVDGAPNWFRHYLDSPQVGLLVLILYRDASRLGGATWYAPQSVGLVAQYHAEHPEGGGPHPGPIMAQCTDFRFAAGKAGDAFLLHPFMMHTGSTNVLPLPRLMENDNVSLREPMVFDRTDPAEFSAVERAILGHLGVERLHFVRQG